MWSFGIEVTVGQVWSGIEETVWSGVVGYRGDCTGPLFGQVWSGIEVTVWSGVVGYRGDC